ncbi:tRNA threonylcarbamoyladenosine biosynthesis protein [[Emmonsia] crescens]|uniref:Ribosome quality control complex subunit 2 n=1 Tax=[Emmonsia] crescens TaxID=73230 RepID=A0A2B7ZTL8_9EURO|nr:tRNA threonylcarbamoyladenosine biosynthesis protein [Emmonsia crescens]
MKQRFSSLDVKVIARELSQALVGLRISNIYDLSSRICLFKLAKPDTRRQLIVDTGFRCHLTEYSRTTAAAPSPFISRLRKFLKTRRVTAVSQLGTDRIIDIELSDGNFHLLLEFYAGGNIILTDKEYKIIALHRIVPEGSDQEEVRVGLQYVLTNKQNYNGAPPLSIERLKDTLQKAKDAAGAPAEAAGNNKRAKKKQAEALRRAVSLGFPEYPPLLLEHAFHVTGFDTSLKPEQVLEDNKLMEKLMLALVEAENVNSSLSAAEDTPGYIVSKTEPKAGEEDAVTATGASKPKNVLYHDFHPFEPKQFENVPGTTILKFDTFNKAVDEYFSSVESQKLESRLTEREETAKKKLDAAQKDQEKRVGVLKEVQELHIRKAQAIEANLLRVEEAMNAVNGLIAQGMDWVEIARLIEMEQSRQNPVAKVIKLPLKLYENTVTLLLGEPTEDEEPMDESDEGEDEESSDEDEDSERKLGGLKKPEQQPQQQLLSIDIDLGISPWANARQYYEQKKAAAVKEEKTLKSTKIAIKSTEKKVAADLKQALKHEKPVLRPARTPFWFEKFIFFVSSDGYLVLGGRDVQQTEILYRRHLKKGDVYVHADVQGAIPIFVKNKAGTPDAPIPPGTLSQAGNLCIATSSAWDSKAVMGAWWVNVDQVSKTTPSGEYLATGGFVIRGEKNQLPPAQLLLGFAVMFQISGESIKNHTKHRVQDEASTSEDAKETQGREGLPSGHDLETPRETESMEIGHQSDESDSSDRENGEIEGGTDNKRTNPLLKDEAESDDSGSDDEQPNIGEDRPQDDDSGDERDYNNTEFKSAEAPELGERETLPKEEAGESQTDTATARPSKHLSARERRLLKKGIPIEQASARLADPESHSSTNVPSRSSTPSVATSTATTNIRGKRGKNKKLATKYQHQDEEDRELALRLLGSAPKPDKLREAAKTKADRQAELEAQKQRRRAQHDRAAQAERERQRTLQQQVGTQAGGDSGDGGDAQLDDADTAADLSCLPSLIGTPVAGDEIVAAIPVCAPWMALGQYKYRVKLQPGTVKKGKAVKEILGKWIFDATAIVNAMEKGKGKWKGKRDIDEGEGEVADKNVNEEGKGEENGEAGANHSLKQLAAMELELIKGWRDVEIMNTLPVGKVKIVSGGGGGGGDKGGKGKGSKPGGGGGKGAKGAKGKGGKK